MGLVRYLNDNFDDFKKTVDELQLSQMSFGEKEKLYEECQEKLEKASLPNFEFLINACMCVLHSSQAKEYEKALAQMIFSAALGPALGDTRKMPAMKKVLEQNPTINLA